MVTRNDLSIIVKEEYESLFADFTLPTETPAAEAEAAPSGRSQLSVVPLSENGNERALVRNCVRGGLLGRFVRTLYLDRGIPRPFRELLTSEYARSHNVPTPEVLAVAFEKAPPFFYRGYVATREIVPGLDLQRELLSADPLERGFVERKRVVASLLGRLVARMHAAGIYHADLHLKNVLLSGADEQPELSVLDLDAAAICERLSDFRKCMNILRLYRSAQKVNRLAGSAKPLVSRSDAVCFLEAYAEEAGVPLKDLMRRVTRMLPLWRIKWNLSDRLGV